MKPVIRFSPLLVLGIILGSAALSTGASDGATCEKYGTAIEFAASPTEAAKLARQQGKLVFVMHVSGNFARPEFT
jgi:hypothetical protein